MVKLLPLAKIIKSASPQPMGPQIVRTGSPLSEPQAGEITPYRPDKLKPGWSSDQSFASFQPKDSFVVGPRNIGSHSLLSEDVPLVLTIVLNL
jgi:hypothetical protein